MDDYEVTIGSAGSCSVQLSDKGLEPVHARIVFFVNGDVPYVVNHGVRASVRVNGRSTKRKRELLPGDELLVGENRFFVFYRRTGEMWTPAPAVGSEAPKVPKRSRLIILSPVYFLIPALLPEITCSIYQRSLARGLAGYAESDGAALGSWKLRPLQCVSRQEGGETVLGFQFPADSSASELEVPVTRGGVRSARVLFPPSEARPPASIRDDDCRKLTVDVEERMDLLHSRDTDGLEGRVVLDCPSVGLRAEVAFRDCAGSGADSTGGRP